MPNCWWKNKTTSLSSLSKMFWHAPTRLGQSHCKSTRTMEKLVVHSCLATARNVSETSLMLRVAPITRWKLGGYFAASCIVIQICKLGFLYSRRSLLWLLALELTGLNSRKAVQFDPFCRRLYQTSPNVSPLYKYSVS